MTILVAGELNPDLVLAGYRTFPTGGKEVLVEDMSLVMGSSSAICAMGLSRLGNSVRFAAKVGMDVWGRFCIETLENAGVDVSGVIAPANIKTGITVSITGPNTDRALVTYPGAIAALSEKDIPDTAFTGCAHLHVSSFFLQDALRPGCASLFRRARAHGLTTSLDTGFDPSERWNGGIEEAISEADLFFPNEVELRALSGCEDVESGVRKLARGRTKVVAKLGSNGAAAFDGERFLSVPAFPVVVTDTTGAGDSFNAGFLHSWLRSRSMADALAFASACGALSTLGMGGTGAQPTEAEAVQFLEANYATRR